jgi:hypothetical protein
MEYVEADATRVLPIVRRRVLAPIRYAHSGVGPAVAQAAASGANGVSRAGGAGGAGRAGADDWTGALPVVSGARTRPTERVRLVDRVRRAGGVRLTERIRLAGRSRPPEIAHE